MKKALFAILLSLTLANASIAQTEMPKHEIGISTQFVFYSISQESSTPMAFLFKKKHGEHQWIRYGMNFDVGGGRDKAKDNNTNSSNTFSVNITPSIGLEKRHQVAEKWLLIWGGDFYTNLNYWKQEAKWNGTNNYYSLQERQTKSIAAGLRPFLGLAIHISPRFYASTEAFANLSALFGKTKSNNTTQNNETSNSEKNFWHVNASLRPASAIFLYYRF